MSTIAQDPNAILAAAIANEVVGHKILLQAKETALTALGSATFEFLANEELRHIEIIEKYAASLNSEETWDGAKLAETSLSDAGSAIRSIFQRFATQFEEARTADDERLEIYQVAMDMERKGYQFYSAAAEKAEDTNAADLFRFLAHEEQRHFQIIQDTHDFLKQPDALLAMEERWMQT